jgi:hypothetical protein
MGNNTKATPRQEHACPARKPSRRALLRARFIVEAALEHGVHIAVQGSPYGPSVSTWAPSAPTLEHQTACQECFRLAVEANLRAIIYRYATPREAA